jgi:hypothetical protein
LAACIGLSINRVPEADISQSSIRSPVSCSIELRADDLPTHPIAHLPQPLMIGNA